MTTEERFIRIENAIHAVAENQARHESAIRDLIVVSRTLLESQKETTTQIQGLQTQTQNQQIQTSEIQAQAREFETRMRALQAKLDAHAELAADTEQRLNALIQVVDRIISRKNGQS